MNSLSKKSGALAVALGLSLPFAAFASSHREAPSISDDPAADNTDLYAWVSPGSHDRMYIVANWIPLEEPAGGPNFHKFSDDVLYEIHLSRGDNLKDAIAYYFKFRTTPAPLVDVANQGAPPGGGKEFFIQLSGQVQTMDVYRVMNANGIVEQIGRNIPVAPVNIGPRSHQFANGAGAQYNDAYAASFIRPLGNDGSEGRVFAGPRDDAFYVDLGGVFDLANLRARGEAQDGVAGYNTHTIALEIPTNRLTANGQAPTSGPSVAQTMGVWAASSRPQVRILYSYARNNKVELGQWVQVSRLGLPLINEVVIGLQDKDRWNSTHPKFDAQLFGSYFLNPILVRDAEAVGIYAALGVPQETVNALKFNRTDILNIISLNTADRRITNVGDVLRVDMGVDSGFPNGRPLQGGARPDQEQADVTDVLATVILSGGALAISDGVDYNDKPLLNEFPFLPLPWEGRSQGHGRPTP